MELKQILQDLKSGIGASESSDLLNLEPYGCHRRLVYRKRGVPPDFEFTETRDMIRGNRLEALIAQEYANLTGHTLIDPSKGFRHPLGVLVSHPDRIIKGPPHKVLEIKCPGFHHFAKIKRYGYPLAWVIQVHAQLACTGLKSGVLAVLNAEQWELLPPYEITYDPEIGRKLVKLARETWPLVKDTTTELPPRLKLPDERCRKCEYRFMCQGERLLEIRDEELKMRDVPTDESLASLVEDYLAAKEVESNAKEILEDVKSAIVAKMGDKLRVDTSVGRITHPIGERNSIDSAALKRDHPDLAAKYSKKSAYRSFRIYPK